VAEHTQEFTPEFVLINTTPESVFTTFWAWFLLFCGIIVFILYFALIICPGRPNYFGSFADGHLIPVAYLIIELIWVHLHQVCFFPN
jgi:uncharacterized membrane protein